MALTTPYKSGSISSVNGTTLVASSISFESTDVGRLIILTNGDGKLQHRKIVTYTSATEVEVDHAWNTTPWLDTVQDVEPSTGDSFVVSYLQSDTAFTNEVDVTDSGEQVRIDAIQLSGGAYVHFTNKQVDLNSSYIRIGLGAGMIFGWYKYIAEEDAQVTDSCHIIDDSLGVVSNYPPSWGTGGTEFGMLDIYGGTILVDEGPVFWRLYCNDGANKVQSRIINAQSFGEYGIGCRVDGNRSIFIATIVGTNNVNSACNARTAVSRISITAIDSLQAGYVWLHSTQGGASGRLIFPRLNSLDRVIRSNNSGNSGNKVMEVIAKKSEVDQIPVFIQGGGSVSGTHTFRYGNLLKPNYVDDSNSVITDTIKTAVIDSTNTIVDTEDVTTGSRSELFIRHSDIATRDGNMVLENSDGTLPSYVTKYAPYELNSFLFGKQINSAIVTAEDFYGATQTLLNDLVLTETDKATIDAYTEIDTPQKFYDRANAYLYDNYAGESSTLVSRDGNTINAGTYDVVLSSSATEVLSLSSNTLTIKSSAFIGNITTSGAVTLDNTDFGGTIVDINGTRSFGSYQIKNLISGSRVQIYNITTGTEAFNSIVNNVILTKSFSTEMSENDAIRIRITYQNSSTAKEPQEILATCKTPSWEVSANQQDALQYNDFQLDGSEVTEVSLDLANGKIEIDITDDDNATTIQRIGAFYYSELMTSDGIANLFGAVNWLSANQISIDQDKVDLKIDNKKSAPLMLTGGRLYRLDGSTIISSTSNSVQIDYSPIYITNAPLIEIIDKNTKLIPALL